MASNSATTTTSSNVSGAPRTFTCFAKLPKELRDQIWKEALPGPRLITIIEHPTSEPFSMSSATPNVHQLRESIRASCEPPALLQVSQQSRDIALKFYKPAFQQILRFPVFFDYNVDILHFKSYRPLASFDQVARRTYSDHIEFPRVRKVAIPHKHLKSTAMHSLSCTMDVIKTWHKVQEVYMVSDAATGPINGFSTEEFKDLLQLHRGIVAAYMTDREREEWTAPNTWFLRERDLEAMTE